MISLWGLDLAAVIKAASTPLQPRRSPLPLPRVLLLKPGTKGRGKQSGGDGSGGGGSGGGCAIRGIDCVRPSFLSGRKRTSLGIIEARRNREAPLSRWDTGGSSGAGIEGDGTADGGSGRTASAVPGAGGGDDFDPSERDGGGGGGCRGRSRKSGAVCNKNRRQCRKARRLRARLKTASAAIAAAEAAISSPVVVQPVVTAAEKALLQTSVGATAESFVSATVGES